MKSGIYKILCIANNKIYVGASSNIQKRFREHKCGFRTGCHGNKDMQEDYNKFGESVFVFSVIEYCKIDDLLEKEAMYISRLFSLFPHGYNMTTGGKGMAGAISEIGRRITAAKTGKKRGKSQKKVLCQDRSSILRGRKLLKNTKSKYVGVSYHSNTNTWRARTIFNKKEVSLGYFATEEEAARAYDRFVIENFGTNSRINFP